MTQQCGLVCGITLFDGVTTNLADIVTHDVDPIALCFQLRLVGIEVERVHFLQCLDAGIGNLVNVPFAPVHRLNPPALLIDFVRSQRGPFANHVLVIDIAVHVDAISIDMEMEYLTLTVVVE